MPINFEFKARCNHLDRVRDCLQMMDAKLIGVDRQTDTYFNVDSGRLKLRQGNIEKNLIYYNRSDLNEPKLSQVWLAPCKETSALLDVLTNALGVNCVVTKRREIYFHGQTKIHLDSLPTLGDFVEVEVISSSENPDENDMRETCQSWMRQFEITEADLISTSYSDMTKSR